MVGEDVVADRGTQLLETQRLLNTATAKRKQEHSLFTFFHLNLYLNAWIQYIFKLEGKVMVLLYPNLHETD